MKYSFTVLQALCVMLIAARPVPAQSSILNQELLKDWISMKDTLTKLANEMPADAYTFKPTDGQRNFGEQVVHIATANILNLNFLRGQAKPPVLDRRAISKEAAIKAMGDSFDYGVALINEQTDRSMFETVQTNPFLGPSSRARVIYFLLGHSWDIYGQMVVYFRMNGKTPPASQRP